MITGKVSRSMTVTVAGIFVLVLAMFPQRTIAQGTKPLGSVKVTLDLANTEAGQALDQVAKQTKWDIYVAKNVTGQVSLKLDQVDGESALMQLTKQFKGSWLRFYLIDKPGDQPSTRTAEQLLNLLSTAQRERFQNLSQDQRRQAFQGRGGQGGSGPQRQGGRGNAATPGQANAQGNSQGNQTFTIDPLRSLRSRDYHQQITISVMNLPFSYTLNQLRDLSGYFVVTEEKVTSPVTLDGTDLDLEKVLDQICQPLNLKWHRSYLVSMTESLTPEQMAQRRDQQWNQQWADYWTMDAQTRQQLLQQQIDRLKNIPSDVLNRIANSPRASRMISRYTNYMTTLTSAQRLELAPLMQQVARVYGTRK